MYSTGMVTIFLYIASVLSFLLGVQYREFFTLGFILGIVFFIIASGTLLVMMRKRMDKQDF